MDKYTKTINELKKEYRNLKLSNTHNKFSNNKLINGGGDIVGAIVDPIAETTFSTDNTLKPINTDPSTIVQNPENKHKILKGPVSMLDFLSNSTKVNLDEISDYTQNFYLDDNLVPLREDNSFLVMNSMIFTYSDFI